MSYAYQFHALAYDWLATVRRRPSYTSEHKDSHIVKWTKVSIKLVTGHGHGKTVWTGYFGHLRSRPVSEAFVAFSLHEYDDMYEWGSLNYKLPPEAFLKTRLPYEFKRVQPPCCTRSVQCKCVLQSLQLPMKRTFAECSSSAGGA
eukprot:7266099-Karenia_brevis.AAC.1